MEQKILITGGAGFIGSHLADELIDHGYQVRVLDNLLAQVHGPGCTRPHYLNPDAEFIFGDVRDLDKVRTALRGCSAVYHFAAAVGVSQSMYEIRKYTDINTLGTSVLLEALIDHPVEKLIVASSMSIYGEGMYQAPDGTPVADARRTPELLKANHWDPIDGSGGPLAPVPTPETKPPELVSVYALSKYVQERLCLIVGRTYHIPTIALRFFNVYGPRQALSNPYTGVLAIFAARLLNGRPPIIFEDGRQRRDFVCVNDITAACRMALESRCTSEVFNVGSGVSCPVLQVAGLLGKLLDKPHLAPIVTGTHRVGDVRHCFGDITKIRTMLGFEPRTTLGQGIQRLAEWLEGQCCDDRLDAVNAELGIRGLTL